MSHDATFGEADSRYHILGNKNGVFMILLRLPRGLVATVVQVMYWPASDSSSL